MISIPKVKEEKFTFVVQFLLDICCIPHVDKASVNELYYEEVPIKKVPVVTPVKEEKPKDEKKDHQKKKAKKKNQKKNPYSKHQKLRKL